MQKKWDALRREMQVRFQQEVDVTALLFIIGLQEVGLKKEKLSKDQKLEVLHVGICAVLEPYGYYSFSGRDRDGWPHWESTEKLPNLNPVDQEQLLKEAIVEYRETFKEPAGYDHTGFPH
jgi:hypothetical protein